VAELLESVAPSDEIMGLVVRLAGWPADPSRNAKALEEVRTFLGEAENAALIDLASLLQLISHTSAAGRVRLDPSLARGLSYYTGAIMEITVPDLAGSLGGGGRYDNLIGTFLGREVPACGFSLGLERILVVMDERKMFPESVVGRNADVMVTLWNHASEADALALAASLRRAGLRVDVYPEPDKLGKQLKYASSRNIPFVTVVGDDEQAAGTVTVKDLRSGEQRAEPRDELPARLRAQITDY
jgi:histidyl-tRNA synthetase